MVPWDVNFSCAVWAVIQLRVATSVFRFCDEPGSGAWRPGDVFQSDGSLVLWYTSRQDKNIQAIRFAWPIDRRYGKIGDASARNGVQNMLMAKTPKKKKVASTEKYRKPTRWARVRLRLAAQVDVMADRNASDFTEEVNTAIREYLQRHSLWPPADGNDDPGPAD